MSEGVSNVNITGVATALLDREGGSWTASSPDHEPSDSPKHTGDVQTLRRPGEKVLPDLLIWREEYRLEGGVSYGVRNNS
jgi:hypothetical protein